MQPTMSFLIFLSILLCCLNNINCKARDTITRNDPLHDNDETVVSAGKFFELGFFSPVGTSNRYLGIWYYGRNPRTFVWIANRDNALTGRTGAAVIDEDGSLKVLAGNRNTYFSTESLATLNSSAKLLDSGNLVLIDEKTGNGLWQSFENPTDTFLPGMKMDDKLKLTSWLNNNNPATGNYTFQKDQENNEIYITRKRLSVYWRSGEPSKFFSTSEMSNQVTFFLENFTINNSNQSSKQYKPSIKDYVNKRLLLNSSGLLQLYSWDDRSGWSVLWSQPDVCSVDNICGNFGICKSENGLECNCLPGFEPRISEDWEKGVFSSGCELKSSPCSMIPKFLNLTSMKVGHPDTPVPDAYTEGNCSKVCLDDCQCRAYTFIGYNSRRGMLNVEAGCWTWTSDLKNLQEKFNHEGINISVRVELTEIGSTKRDCEPCGATVIPYPLSTRTNCGDPTYYSFSCNNLTNQVDFRTPNASYQVISINKEKHKFVMEVDNGTAESCEVTARQIMLLIDRMPFQVTNSCFTYPFSSSSGNPAQSQQMIEISWKQPSEPTCNSSSDCLDWPDSNCTGNGQRRCLCRPNYRWDGSILNCTAVVSQPESQPKTLESNDSKFLSTMKGKAVVISTLVIAAALAFCGLGYSIHKRKMLADRTESADSVPKNPFLFAHSERRSTDLIEGDNSKNIDVCFFKLEIIIGATDNFSDANKLGEGGFGPVYKGIFPGGQEIAVKRLSSHSGQGMEEFQNEVVLIAKLQHRNLVRLLGYCIEGNEKILLYEYMPNKSLDSFIFDKQPRIFLDWKKRFDIILGIARGLLYLHEDSRLRIIHRDLKTSNILLDDDMIPKISDFGLARNVKGILTEANTKRVVGTYGYMSPEYISAGLFSVKSDVFSFGVIVLEIVSGKRNTGFYHSKEAMNLLDHAWRLWKEKKALELLDHTLINSCDESTVLKCINIGLLCVEEDPSDRPTMSKAFNMLGSEAATIPSPNQPAYVVTKRPNSTASSSSSKLDSIPSHNELTITINEGR